MIIRCPECASTYEISATTQVVGKKVRCSHCSHVWRVETVEEDQASAAEEPMAEEAASSTAASEPDAGEEDAREAGLAADGAEPDHSEDDQDSAVGDMASEPGGRIDRPNLGVAAASASLDSLLGERADTAPAARMPRVRESRYSLDPFEGLAGTGPVAQSRAGSSRHSGANGLSARSSAERRLERERNYSNGHAGRDEGLTIPGMDPDVPRARGSDAEWEQEESFDDYAGDDVEQGRPMPPVSSEGGLERKRGSRVLVVVGWLALLCTLAGLGLFAVFDRETVSRTLPGTVPVYAALGMPVNMHGLAFRDVKYVWTVDGKGRPAIDVGGEIENVSAEPRNVPTVVFAFQDDEGLELFHWATTVRRSALPPGKRSKFQARIPAPPEAVRNLQLRFAKAR